MIVFKESDFTLKPLYSLSLPISSNDNLYNNKFEPWNMGAETNFSLKEDFFNQINKKNNDYSSIKIIKFLLLLISFSFLNSSKNDTSLLLAFISSSTIATLRKLPIMPP